MKNLFKKSSRWFLLFVCLILWNLALVSCGDDEGDGDGEFANLESKKPESMDWISKDQVRLQWKSSLNIKSYLVYDMTQEGPNIRGAVDSNPASDVVEITLDDIDFSEAHDFRIVPEAF